MPALAPPSKILVTGGTGYIGSWVIHFLLEQGFKVRAAVRSIEKAEPLKEQFEGKGELEFVVVEDFIKEGAFDSAAVGVDGVVHLASPLTAKSDDPDDFIKPAVGGTMNLVKAAALPGSTVKRFVFTSSTATVSRTLDTPKVFDESDWSVDPELVEKQGRSAPWMVKYRASKTLAEKAARAYVDENAAGKFDLVVLNPPFVFGPPLIRSLPVGTSVDWWFGAVIKGTQTDPGVMASAVSYVDVRDVARAHVLSLTRPDAGGERIILAAGATSWQEAVEFVGSLEDTAPLKEEKARGLPDIERVPYLVRYNSEKSKRVLGFEYRKYEDTIRDMIKELSERGF